MTIISGGFWFQNNCLLVIPKTQSAGVRYRYPGEDWVVIPGNGYTLDDNVAGQCENSYYSVRGTMPYYFRVSGELAGETTINVWTGQIQRIVNSSNPWFVINPLNNDFYDGICIRVIDMDGTERDVCDYPTDGSRGIKNEAVENLVIQRTFANRVPDNRGDDCGSCTLIITQDDLPVYQESRNVCPEVEVLNSACVNDEETRLQIESTPLGFIHVTRVETNPEAHNFEFSELSEPEIFVTFDIFDLGNNEYAFQVQVNGNSDSDVLSLNNQESNLSIDGSFENDILNLTVADGISQDTATINIPISEIPENPEIPELPSIPESIPSNLSIAASYFNDVLTITVADGQSQDTAQVFIDADINNFGGGGGSNPNDGGDDLSCDAFSQELQDCCSQLLAAINDNQNAIENNFQKIQEVEQYVTIDISGTAESEYQCESVLDENGQPTGDQEATFTDTNYTGIGLLGLQEQLKIINQNLAAIYGDLCGLSTEPQDVVAIVASDKDLHRVKTKVLIVQFVLLDVYPKRSNTDSLWQVQIPAAKDSYDWTTNFNNLRRIHGNQYAELHFNEPYVPVSGWFRDAAAANAFFNTILPLTNATEKNRKLPIHSNPEMNIAVFETRPYRAFIKSVNNQGVPVCHAQYRPVIEPEN